MASTEATLAWALQVDVLTLGVHFEAYVNLLETIETLRLCNRYGQGAQAAIRTLPPELVKLVGDILISDERLELRRLWHQELRCHQHLCEPSEHIEPERYEKLLEASSTGPGLMTGWRMMYPLDLESMTPYETLRQCLDDDCEYWDRTHDYLRGTWEGRVDLERKDSDGDFTSPFSRDQDILKKHFGLEIWTSNVRVKYDGHVSYWQGEGAEPACTTIAFLKLPGAKKTHTKARLTGCEKEERHFWIEHGAGVPVMFPDPLSAQIAKRLDA